VNLLYICGTVVYILWRCLQKWKEQKNFLFPFLEALVPIISIVKVLIFSYFPRTFSNKKFSGLYQLCFLLIVYFTYLNYNYIFLNVGYKKLLRGTCWVLFSLLLDWSFDHIWFALRLILLVSKFTKNNNFFHVHFTRNF
jgi:hypothetical protein